MPLLVLWARRTKRARVTWSSWSVWAGSQVSGNFTARQSGRRLASKHSCPGTRSRQWQAVGAAVVVAVVVVVVVVFGTKTNEAEASWTYKFLTILLSLAGEANLYLCVCVSVCEYTICFFACVCAQHRSTDCHGNVCAWSISNGVPPFVSHLSFVLTILAAFFVLSRSYTFALFLFSLSLCLLLSLSLLLPSYLAHLDQFPPV